MSISTLMWIVCGVIYALLVVGVIALIIVNRIKNRKGKDQ